MNKEVKKYSRRAFLAKTGFGAKIAGGAVLYGTVGGVIGKGYEEIRDGVRKITKPLENFQKKTDGVINKTKEYMQEFYDGLSGTEHTKREIPKESVTRRGFLNKLVRTINEYPVASGIGIGASYGGGKQALGGYDLYQNKLEMAEMGLQGAQTQEEMIALREEIRELRKLIINGGIEKKLEGENLVIIGTVGMIFSMFSISIKFTGYSVANNFAVNPIGMSVLFLLSLVFLLAGMKRFN